MKFTNLKAGATIGVYRLRRRVARSRWTSVYSAESEIHPGKFAVKIFDLNGSNEEAIGTPDEQVWRNRFYLEARILDAMDHPGIIALHDRGCLSDGRPYHIMPFINANLAYEIKFDVDGTVEYKRRLPPKRMGPMPVQRSLLLLHQITDALATLHSRDVIHRDLKPGNVLLSRIGDGHAILCDFGMARWGDQVFDVPGELIGSKLYVCPEQKRDPGLSGTQADIYSLGRIAFRMLAGRLPGENERSAHDFNREVSTNLDQFITSCLEDDPANRPEDALAVQAVLKGL